jgi:uncharacterized protein (TIGR02147 family)
MGAKNLSARKTILVQASEAVKPTGFVDYSRYLESLFQQIKSQQAYTYLEFSADLGFGETTYVHQIVRRYRSLTMKNAEKIASHLELTGFEKKYFFNLVKYAHSRSAAERDAAWKEILRIKANEVAEEPEQDILEYFSQWYHPVVREYIKIEDGSQEPATVARELVPALRPEQVRESLELLERLKLIETDPETGKYRQTNERVSTGHRVKTLAVMNYHIQMINLAKDSLANVPGKQRDISALTLSVSAESYEKIKAMIHTFQLQLLEEAEKTPDPEKVVQVNIQMFPVSKSRKQG